MKLPGVYRYKEGRGGYAGSGIYLTNQPLLGFVCMLKLGRLRVYFRYSWGWTRPRLPREFFFHIRRERLEAAE